jgi:RimJ/RimL family protein N-acetyltransferase
MQFLGGVQRPEVFRAAFERAQICQTQNGFCFWLVERLIDRTILGFCGLKIATDGPTIGEIEIGWGLREDAWGRGYGHEAATASLAWAWRNLSCVRVVANTVEGNTRSRRLMDRLGMHLQPSLAFDRPAYPPGHPCRPHITYTIARPAA